MPYQLAPCQCEPSVMMSADHADIVLTQIHMMRALAFAALVGAVHAGLTPYGGPCTGGGADSALCEIKAVELKVAAETSVSGCITLGGGTRAGCDCWACMSHTEARTAVFETMDADNDDTEKTIAAALTVMKPSTYAACGAACGLGAANGPVAITETGFEIPDTVLPATGNWCGEWSDRQKTETCKTSIFDAKGLLFLIIIGGALAIIFFQCSIMAVVAAMSSGKSGGDAKP